MLGCGLGAKRGCWQVGSSGATPRTGGSRLCPLEQQCCGPLASLTGADGMFQIGKLRSELEMVSGNVRVMSEMLTELVPTQAEPADLELLQVSKRLSPADFLFAHTRFLSIHTTVFMASSELWSPWEMLKPGTLDFIRLEFRALQHSGLNKIAPLASVSSYQITLMIAFMLQVLHE